MKKNKPINSFYQLCFLLFSIFLDMDAFIKKNLKQRDHHFMIYNNIS